MKTFRQFEPLRVKDYTTDTFLFEPHGHTYYELIYIFKGKGTHELNNNQMPYQAGDLFLMSPDDRHHFVVKQSTRFMVIKFTDDYFDASALGRLSGGVIPQVIMRIKTLKEAKLKLNDTAAQAVKSAVQNISIFQDGQQQLSSSYLYFQLLSIFALIKKELPNQGIPERTTKNEAQEIIQYIQQNIYHPERCRIKTIVQSFNISETYFGDYFKRNFGISYRSYLNKYRISLIETRIKGGKLNMKQIAEEFGFSDESHFSNYFVKERNQRPKAFKKQASVFVPIANMN